MQLKRFTYDGRKSKNLKLRKFQESAVIWFRVKVYIYIYFQVNTYKIAILDQN